MDKIRRWNKLAVWIAQEIITANGAAHDALTFEGFSIYNSRQVIMKEILNKMEEIEKEIPEPDEN